MAMKQSSHASKFFIPEVHYQAHLSDNEISRNRVNTWKDLNDLNRHAARLMEKYTDLIRFEPTVGEVVARAPMLLNLSAKELSQEALAGLRMAIFCWKENREFYTQTFFEIERSVLQNNKKFARNEVELYKSACLTLPKFERQITHSYNCLAGTIRGLRQAGYTYGAIRPYGENRYYRTSA